MAASNHIITNSTDFPSNLVQPEFTVTVHEAWQLGSLFHNDDDRPGASKVEEIIHPPIIGKKNFLVWSSGRITIR